MRRNSGFLEQLRPKTAEKMAPPTPSSDNYGKTFPQFESASEAQRKSIPPGFFSLPLPKKTSKLTPIPPSSRSDSTISTILRTQKDDGELPRAMESPT